MVKYIKLIIGKEMNKSLLIAIPLASAIMFSGCATILSGKKQNISITSNPSKKEVTIGAQTVTTPTILSVDRSDNDLIVRSNDCEGQQIVASEINPVFFVNILSGGAFGSTTDYASGAMWKYDENVNLNCSK